VVLNSNRLARPFWAGQHSFITQWRRTSSDCNLNPTWVSARELKEHVMASATSAVTPAGSVPARAVERRKHAVAALIDAEVSRAANEAGSDAADGGGWTLSVAEAAHLLARDRTRVYALVRSSTIRSGFLVHVD
jgi:hypothetical protein